MSESFLSRWTRRKLSVRAAELANKKAVPASVVAPVHVGLGEEPAAASGSRPETDPTLPQATGSGDPWAHLPAPDEVTPETDLAPFLRAGVPALLRNAALRRMWSMDPTIRDFVSEAREYAYDWNSPGGVPGLGPLLPSDDVEAMLARLLRAAPETDRVATHEPLIDAEAPFEQDADTALASTPTLGMDGPMTPSREPIPALSAPAVKVSECQTIPGVPAHRPETHDAIAPTCDQKPRLRRHGGAIPVPRDENAIAADKNPS
ncbi:DUF3306 domain-containing protein [Methylobacterium gnaphalii]|uniref:DUF3306 domain-containing protein n=1 Tax=Methylobacterium gnaphalii TaxID=1010610 RepID=A0A512JQF1_9HYPH|nr:DUF3306 domain-containing protein [Methylobacterium gnaphalii]GEP12178.1 hypothetical protein MGN01_40230 [Methylobacterium gnaphalii]GJD67482.1 hypothetical protein MMMDOFMJ_0397 [Methylobacterium gnaphalii]GLS51300.1 hypothetical protein GCM10007885_41550 [Methylobacterium gnaphalii]